MGFCYEIRRILNEFKKTFYKGKKEFEEEWSIKRKVGFIYYVVIGSIRCAIFLIFMYIIKFLIEWKVQFNENSVISIAVSSILLPLISWGINEIRFKRR